MASRDASSCQHSDDELDGAVVRTAKKRLSAYKSVIKWRDWLAFVASLAIMNGCHKRWLVSIFWLLPVSCCHACFRSFSFRLGKCMTGSSSDTTLPTPRERK